MYTTAICAPDFAWFDYECNMCSIRQHTFGMQEQTCLTCTDVTKDAKKDSDFNNAMFEVQC